TQPDVSTIRARENARANIKEMIDQIQREIDSPELAHPMQTQVDGKRWESLRASTTAPTTAAAVSTTRNRPPLQPTRKTRTMRTSQRRALRRLKCVEAAAATDETLAAAARTRLKQKIYETYSLAMRDLANLNQQLSPQRQREQLSLVQKFSTDQWPSSRKPEHSPVHSVPKDGSCFQLTINSLIVADALSNLGPDFDLLVASHRDNRDGIRQHQHFKSPIAGVAAVANGEADFNPWRRPAANIRHCQLRLDQRLPLRRLPPPHPWIDESAGAGGGSGCPVQRIGVHFSELDIIANQKTLVELVSFAKRINPADTYAAKEEKEAAARTGAVRISEPPAASAAVKAPGVRSELQATFSRLHVLLVRVLDDPQQQRKSAKKVATVTLTGMQVTANHVDSSSFATASLASVSVLDLTNSSRLHRSIVWIGGDPSESTDERCPQREQVPLADELTLPLTLSVYSDAEGDREIEAQMARSLCYLHAPGCSADASDAASAASAADSGLDGIRLTVRLDTPVIASLFDVDGFERVLRDRRQHQRRLAPLFASPGVGTLYLDFKDISVMSVDLAIAGANLGDEAEHPAETAAGKLLAETLGSADGVEPASLGNHLLCVEAVTMETVSVRLPKAVFDQVLKSLDNLVYDEWSTSETTSSATETAASEAQLPDAAASAQSEYTPLVFDFALPELRVEIVGDLSEGDEKGIARLTAGELAVHMAKPSPWVKDVSLRLGTLNHAGPAAVARLPNSSSAELLGSGALCSAAAVLRPLRVLSELAGRRASDDEDFGNCRPAGAAVEQRRASGSNSGRRRWRWRSTSSRPVSHRARPPPRPPCWLWRRAPALRPPPLGASIGAIRHRNQSRQLRRRRRCRRGRRCRRLRCKLIISQILPRPTRKPTTRLAAMGSGRGGQADGAAAGGRRPPGPAEPVCGTLRGDRPVCPAEFNSLVCNLNLQAWVLLLDFLNLGSKFHERDVLMRMSDTTKVTTILQESQYAEEEICNQQIAVSVAQFSLVLNDRNHSLCRATMSELHGRLRLRDGNLDFGRTAGQLHPAGPQPHWPAVQTEIRNLLDLRLFKYGLPDPGLTRDCDARLRLRMASVRYVHSPEIHHRTVDIPGNCDIDLYTGTRLEPDSPAGAQQPPLLRFTDLAVSGGDPKPLRSAASAGSAVSATSTRRCPTLPQTGTLARSLSSVHCDLNLAQYQLETDLVSTEVAIHDTRFADLPANGRPNVFSTHH
uniref:VPS13_mid_rpt domain-containing protein n=1 Tax=Macrostomum lignano TaxID=282301 RepID=A0A1I8F7C6_9PLAT